MHKNSGNCSSFLFSCMHDSWVWNISFCSFPFMLTAIFVPISFPMPTCLIHAAFDLWRIVKKNKLSFLISLRNIFIWGNVFFVREYTSELYYFTYAYSIHTQCTCGLWDVKQMIFVHDYLKLMDKIWPLSALHLHHRRTSTNDRSRQVTTTHCLHTEQQFCFLSQSTIIVCTVNNLEAIR